MKQLYKKHKKTCMFFFVLFISTYLCTVTVSAACPYDNWEYDLVKRISVAGMFSDMFIRFKAFLLVGLAEIVDDFSKAIDTLLSLNLYEGIKNVFNIEASIYPIAWALFSLVIIIAAIYLMIFPDKLKISNLLRSILISGCLITVAPSIFSVMTDIKNAGINDVSNISITGSKGVKHTIGDELLAAVTVDMKASGEVGKVRYISQTEDFKRKTGICYGIDYTKTLSNKSGNFLWKVTDIDAEESSQILFEDLSFDNYLYLMGIYDTYSLCKDAKQVYDRIPSDKTNKKNATDDEIRNSGGYIMVVYASKNIIGPATKYIDPYSYYNDYLVPSINNKTSKCKYLNSKEKSAIKNEILSSEKGGVCDIGTAAPKYRLFDYEDDKNSADIETCVRRIIDYLMQNGYMEKLNIENNEKEFEKGTTYDYHYASLHTQEDHDDLGWAARLTDYLDGDHFGKATERVYAYDLDFVKGLILMIAVFISFLFAGLKLTRMLFDILFMQVIAPVVFASDLQESGRTKKMISEIIGSFIIIILVFLIIKLYLIVLLWSFSKNFSIVVTLFIIIGGAGFVIDGPDVVVKILGIDAGIKSGHGMLMGAMAGVNLAKNAGKGAANLVKSTGHIAGKTANAAKKGASIAKSAGGAIGKSMKSESGVLNKAAMSTAKNLGKATGLAKQGANNAIDNGKSPTLGAAAELAGAGALKLGSGARHLGNGVKEAAKEIKNTPNHLKNAYGSAKAKASNSSFGKAFNEGMNGNPSSEVSNSSNVGGSSSSLTSASSPTNTPKSHNVQGTGNEKNLTTNIPNIASKSKSANNQNTPIKNNQSNADKSKISKPINATAPQPNNSAKTKDSALNNVKNNTNRKE